MSKELDAKAKTETPATRETENHPFLTLHREMNRLFDHFFGDFDLAPSSNTWERGLSLYSPRIDMTDGDKEIRITAELPGMDEKDVDVSLTNQAVVIKGQKEQADENKGKNHYRMERTYGAFERVLPLPTGIMSDKAEATFKKGVLTVVIPKTAEKATSVKKIDIKVE